MPENSFHVPIEPPRAARRPRRTIVWLLPDGAQSLVVLRTGLLARITADPSLRWVFVSPLADAPGFSSEFRRAGAEVEAWPAARPGFWDRQLHALRQEAWRASVDTATAAVFAERLRWSEPKRYRLHRPLARLVARAPGGRAVLEQAYRRLIGEGRWGRFFDQFQPQAVVLGSAGIKPQEAPAARVAWRRRVPMYGVVPSWDNLTAKGPLPFPCDRLSVWCESMQIEAAELFGYRPEQVDVAGPPSFDPHFRRLTADDRRRFIESLQFDPGKRLITYTGVPHENCPFGVQLVEMLAQMIRNHAFGFPAQLLVRLHPQDRFENYAALEGLPDVRIEKPGRYWGDATGQSALLRYYPTAEEVRRLTETLAFSDCLVNVASTITLEACALDRPTVNIAFNLGSQDDFLALSRYFDTTHFKPLVSSGATRVVHSQAELREAVHQAFTQPSERSRARRALYRRYDPFGDGRAADRLAAALLRFVDAATSSGSLPFVDSAKTAAPRPARRAA